jgi:hypothetical protein
MPENNSLSSSLQKSIRNKRDIISRLEREWDRLDNEGTSASIGKQNDITKDLDKLNGELVELEIALQDLNNI